MSAHVIRRSVENFYIIAPQPHSFLIDAWRDALLAAASSLPDGAVPDDDYDYHLPHCTFNQARAR